MNTKNQFGFSPSLGIVVVIVIVILGLLGYTLMKQVGKQPSYTDETPTTQNNGATKYLEIKEWGVRFALTTDTADAYYDAKTLSSHDSMSLRSHSLDSEPECTTAPQAIATLFRVPINAEDESLPGKKYSETQDGKIVGNYFYFIQGTQDSCTDNIEKQIILQGVRNSFITAGPTIEAAAKAY